MYYYYTNKQEVNPWYFEVDVLETIQAISDSSIISENIGPVYGAGKLADGYNELTQKQNGNIMTEYIARKVMDKLRLKSNYHKKQPKLQKQNASEDARYYPNLLKRQYN